jgi:NADP-dependent 3-hydroxy acid dehydrogenase YdfG
LPKCEVETYSASTIKAKELKEVADKVKGWDVLVLSAGRAINPKSIEESDPDGWWDVMEVRVPSPLDLSTHHH